MIDRAPQYEAALGKLLQYISYKPRTEFEIKSKLHLVCGQADGAACFELVLNRLDELGYINDVSYAQQIITEGLKPSKLKSRLEITHFLKKRGVNLNAIDSALNELYPPDVELIILEALISKKLPKLKKSPTAKQTLIKSLTRRGFNYHLVSQSISSLE